MPGTTETSVSVPARQVAAVVIGNALEFYDFITYSYFAVYIGRAFFPSSDPTASLLASLGTFGVGFVTRPIGGFIIGRMGDRIGRKPAMIFCFALMGIAIAGLALTPPQSMIGIAAPALVIFFRMLQGFALGGEVGPTTAFLLEVAPPGKRGLFTSFQSGSQAVATLAAGLVGFELANNMNAQQLQDFGWRIAFLIGVAIVPFGLMMRRKLPETFHAPDLAHRQRIPLRPYFLVALLGVMMLACGTIGTYVRGYLTTYAIATLHMPANVAFSATIVVGVCGVAFSPLGGILSDRYGRKSIMLIAGALSLLTILPAFYAIVYYRTTAALLGASAVMSILATLSVIPMITWITESLPAPIRSGGLAIVYAVTVTAFGGTTQFAIAWFIKVTANPMAPAWYWSASMIVGLIAMLLARESAPCKIAKLAPVSAPLSGSVPDVIS